MPVLNPLSPHRLDFAFDPAGDRDTQMQAMNQAFLHDILNTAGGLKGVAEMLTGAKANDDEELRTLALAMATQLVEEISAQRDLLDAESGSLETKRREVSGLQMIEDLAERYRRLPVSEGRRIRVDRVGEEGTLATDPRLLERVLSNMLINALEAEPEGSTITIGCKRTPGSSQFWVHNPGYIPPEIQPRIFDFNSSTKGSGRGRGTYSMLLLGERFLRGQVGFSTDPDRGTTFRITLSDSWP